MTRIRTALLGALGAALLLTASPVTAQEGLKGKTYHFGVNEARTNISFVSEADIETIHGTGNNMQGHIEVDATGKKASGTIKVGVRTLSTGIDLRDQHMRSADWLDAARHPWIEMEITSATENPKNPKEWDWKGKLFIKGEPKDLSGKARVVAIPNKIGKQLGKGEWVHVRFEFPVKITEFGVNIPSGVVAKVSDTWQVKVDVFASTAKPSGN